MSLFVIDKKRFRKEHKHVREELYNVIRKEVKTLIKLRHPSILHILEPLTEDSHVIYFGTEVIEGSLKYFIDDPNKRNIIPSEIELKAQIYELVETITFLHNNAHMIHLAISPENIYLTSGGSFKLAGFFFSQTIASLEGQISPNINFTPSSPNLSIIPHLGFCAPEVVRDNIASSASDAFSVGCFIFNLLQVANNNKNEYLFEVGDHCSKSAYLDELQKFKVDSHINKKLAGFTAGASSLLTSLLIFNSNQRGQLTQAHNHDWFNDPRIKTLEYLDHLNEKEQQHKIQFLNGLGGVLGEFDNKLITRRILPKLAQYLTLEKLSSHVLGPIMIILEKEGLCSKTDFYSSVWPQLEALCKGKEISAQGLYLIIKNTEIWLKLLHMQDFQSTLLILYQKGIDCGVSKIQDYAISIIPSFAKKIEYATLKNSIIPRLLRLALNTNVSSLKAKCIESLSQFSSFVDAQTVKKAIIPTFEKLCKVDSDGRLHTAIIKTIETFLKLFNYQVFSCSI